MYQLKVDVYYMLNAVKSVLADVSSVSLYLLILTYLLIYLLTVLTYYVSA